MESNLTKKQNWKYKKRFKQEHTPVMAASRNSYAVEFSSKVSKEEKDHRTIIWSFYVTLLNTNVHKKKCTLKFVIHVPGCLIVIL